MTENDNALEILINLIYLAKHNADYPEKVVDFLSQAEQYASRLVELRYDSSSSEDTAK